MRPLPQRPATAASEPRQPVAAPVPVDPLRPEVRLDLDDRAARVDLWDRVRRGFAMPDLDNDLVRERERWYASRPDYVAAHDRARRPLPVPHRRGAREARHADRAGAAAVHRERLQPAGDVDARARRACGSSSRRPASDFDLKQNVFRDDRRDVLASTRAALDYLQKLYGMFGDWQLALAAYNWGEGSVQRAIARNQRAGLPHRLPSLRMPAETRGYVPKLQAVKNIVAAPATSTCTLPTLDNHPYFLSVPIERDIDVALAIKLAGDAARGVPDRSIRR